MQRAYMMLWDIHWTGHGYGWPGWGPFATRRLAEACLRTVGEPGEVRPRRCILAAQDLESILRGAPHLHARALSVLRAARAQPGAAIPVPNDDLQIAAALAGYVHNR
ncbi:MAG TPA: hypothetical protein PKB14_01410 [Rubrivivax sp.]|nr:hypothetical protein [Rubrivivax sp.]